MAPIKAGEAYIQTSLRGGDKVRKSLKAITARLKGVGIAGAKIAAVGLAAGATAFAAFSVKAASDLEETMNKFNVVFGKNAKAVKEWGDAYAAQIGRSEEQIARFLSNAQDLLIPLGFEEGAATKMSQDLTILSTDLASFNNMADADVMRDLQAALTGSGEVMKKYGVIVSEAAVKQQLLQDGFDPTTATNQQKVMARYNLILAGTTAAQNDATRSAGSFANQMKALQGKALDFAANIGSILLPVLSGWIDELFALVEGLSQSTDSIDETAASAEGLAASFKSGVSPIEAMVVAVSQLMAIFKGTQLVITDTLIVMARMVQFAGKFSKALHLPELRKDGAEFAKTFEEILLRDRVAQQASFDSSSSIGFGDGYDRLLQKGNSRRAARKKGNVQIGRPQVADSGTSPDVAAVVETIDTAAVDLSKAANDLSVAAESQRTTLGSFQGSAIEQLVSLGKQDRKLSAREKELAALKELEKQGKDANAMFREMLQAQKERISFS